MAAKKSKEKKLVAGCPACGDIVQITVLKTATEPFISHCKKCKAEIIFMPKLDTVIREPGQALH